MNKVKNFFKNFGKNFVQFWKNFGHGFVNAFTKVGAKKNFIRFAKSNGSLSFWLPVVAILLSFLLGSIILACIGANPGRAIVSMFQGSGILPKARYGGGQSQFSDFMKLLNNATPLVFASLAVSVALSCGMFNIGISGVMVLSGFISTVAIGYSSLPHYVARPLVILLSLLVGVAAGGLVGFLKYKFNINEVVQAIMFNYTFMYTTNYFIYKFFLNPVTRSSNTISNVARLTLTNVKAGNVRIDVPLGFFLLIITAVLLYIFLNRTKDGFELRAVGLNAKCAEYAGISVKKNVILAMAISGGLAGMAGATYFLGSTNTIKPEVLPSTGFDAIAVCLLGGSNPIGIFLASLLISGVTTGGTYMQARAGVSTQVPSLIIGIMLTFAACTAFMKYYIQKVSLNMEEDLKKEGLL